MEHPGELTRVSNAEAAVVRQTSVALHLCYNIFRLSGDLVTLYVANKGMTLCTKYVNTSDMDFMFFGMDRSTDLLISYAKILVLLSHYLLPGHCTFLTEIVHILISNMLSFDGGVSSHPLESCYLWNSSPDPWDNSSQ